MIRLLWILTPFNNIDSKVNNDYGSRVTFAEDIIHSGNEIFTTGFIYISFEARWKTVIMIITAIIIDLN